MDLTWADVQGDLERQKDLLRNLLPLAPDAQTVSKIRTRVAACSLKLFRAFLLTTNRDQIIKDALAPLEKKIMNGKTKPSKVLDLVEEMQKVGEEAEDEYLESLTDEVVMADENFVQFREEVEQICQEASMKMQQKNIATADTQELETEDESESSPSASGSYIPTVDPVTKLALMDPVKNIHCNHFYGKKSIRELMQGNPKARCPYAACPNKQYLRGDHLVFDGDMAAKIAAKIASKAGEEQHQGKPNKGKDKRNRRSVVDVD